MDFPKRGKVNIGDTSPVCAVRATRTDTYILATPIRPIRASDGACIQQKADGGRDGMV